MSAEYDHLIDTIEELQNQLACERVRGQRLQRAQLEAFEKLESAHNKECSQLIKQLSELKLEFKETVGDTLELEKAAGLDKRRYNDAKTEVQHLKTLLDEESKQKSEILLRYTAAEDANCESKRRSSVMIKELQQKVADLESKVACLEADNGSLKGMLTLKEAQIECLSEQTSQLQSEQQLRQQRWIQRRSSKKQSEDKEIIESRLTEISGKLAKKVPGINKEMLDDFLVAVNEIWMRRESKKIAEERAKWNRKVTLLKRKIEQQRPSSAILQNADLKRLSRNVREYRARLRSVQENKQACRQLTKTRVALRGATSQLMEYADENQELRYRIRINATRHANQDAMRSGTLSPYQNDESFIEGAVWMGQGALRSVSALQRSIECKTAEFLHQTRRPSPNTALNRDSIRVRFIDDLESKVQFCKNAVEQALEQAVMFRSKLSSQTLDSSRTTSNIATDLTKSAE